MIAESAICRFLCESAETRKCTVLEVSGAQSKLNYPKAKYFSLLATLWFEKRVNLCSNPRFLKKKLKFQLTYGSSNWVSLIAIDFTQSTWFTTSKVNCKNISEFLSKNFPIDFRSPIDFSQLHMIRPLVFDSTYNCWISCVSEWQFIAHFLLNSFVKLSQLFWNMHPQNILQTWDHWSYR